MRHADQSLLDRLGCSDPYPTRSTFVPEAHHDDEGARRPVPGNGNGLRVGDILTGPPESQPVETIQGAMADILGLSNERNERIG